MTPPCPFTWMLSPPGYSKVSGGPDSMVLAIGKGKVPAGIRWEHRIWAWERHSGIRAMISVLQDHSTYHGQVVITGS
jgi:hypothetical protein